MAATCRNCDPSCSARRNRNRKRTASWHQPFTQSVQGHGTLTRRMYGPLDITYVHVYIYIYVHICLFNYLFVRNFLRSTSEASVQSIPCQQNLEPQSYASGLSADGGLGTVCLPLMPSSIGCTWELLRQNASVLDVQWVL